MYDVAYRIDAPQPAKRRLRTLIHPLRDLSGDAAGNDLRHDTGCRNRLRRTSGRSDHSHTAWFTAICCKKQKVSLFVAAAIGINGSLHLTVEQKQALCLIVRQAQFLNHHAGALSADWRDHSQRNVRQLLLDYRLLRNQSGVWYPKRLRAFPQGSA